MKVLFYQIYVRKQRSQPLAVLVIYTHARQQMGKEVKSFHPRAHRKDQPYQPKIIQMIRQFSNNNLQMMMQRVLINFIIAAWLFRLVYVNTSTITIHAVVPAFIKHEQFRHSITMCCPDNSPNCVSIFFCTFTKENCIIEKIRLLNYTYTTYILNYSVHTLQHKNQNIN